MINTINNSNIQQNNYCNICPRKCNVDRNDQFGFCHSTNEFKVAKAMLHFWEEPCISGKNGSGAVFFTGCNLGCVFCQNQEISHRYKGKIITEDSLIKTFESLIEQGANNINLVSPTHYATKIAKVLQKWQSPVPIVYNSSGYESIDTLKMLDGLVDIYLTDFKYIRNDKAQRYCGAKDYPQVAKDALKEMKRQQNEDIFDNGLMKKGVIIRHLIMPSNTNSSIELLDFLCQNYKDTYISLMAQYMPCGDLSNYNEIKRKITKREYDKVVDFALDKGFENIFIQELSSADSKYVPIFDLTGML